MRMILIFAAFFIMKITTLRQSITLTEQNLDGKDYLIGPIVLAKVGVLNGVYLTAEAINKNTVAWSDIPVPLSHPIDENGDFMSAKSPEVLREYSVGRFMNAYVDGDSLKGEVWIDVEKAKNTDKGKELLLALAANKTIEVSSGFFADIEMKSGMYGGQRYEGIWHNLVPDHAAILLDEIGACSIEDGCGFPRANVDVMPENAAAILSTLGGCPCGCQDEAPAANVDFNDGVMIALYPNEEQANTLALEEGDNHLRAEDLHLTMLYLGTTGELQAHKNDIMSAVRFYAGVQTIIRGKLNGFGRFMGDDEFVPHVALVDSVQLDAARNSLIEEMRFSSIPFQSSQHGFTPHITLAYLPVGESASIDGPPMDFAFGDIALVWGDEKTFFELQGKISANEDNKQMSEETTTQEVEIKVDEIEFELPAEIAEELAELRESVTATNAFFEQFGGVEQLAAVVANAQGQLADAQKRDSEEREQLTPVLTANGMTEEEIAATSLPVLRKFAANASTDADYSGIGAPVANADVPTPPKVLFAKSE